MHAKTTSDDEESTPCAVCGSTFRQRLASLDGASRWTFHWDRGAGVTVVAETCSDACSETFEAARR